MEIARAFSELKKKPKRPLVFSFFGGEEMQVLGSEYFVEHLPIPFEKVHGMVNLDMVGEGDGLICSYSSGIARFGKILEEADRQMTRLTPGGEC
jgi:Zn-dependent M28 family amino/carboxypeptidase